MRRRIETYGVKDKRSLADRANHKGITLNGNRAQVSGVRNDFATITDLTTGLSAEWAWPTVRHVLDHKDGAFQS